MSASKGGRVSPANQNTSWKLKSLQSLLSVIALAISFTFVCYPQNIKANNGAGSGEMWKYRLGDSPVSKEGKLLWLEETGSDSSWQSISRPADIPAAPGQRNLWIKLRLNNRTAAYSALFIGRIEKVFEVYLDSVRIYSFGQFDAAGKIAFPGMAWHMITLKPDSRGRTLFLRIRSDSKYIGIYSPVLFGTTESFISEIVKTGLSKTVLGTLLIFTSLMLFLFLLFKARIKQFAGIIIFMTASGIWTLANTKLTQILIYSPRLIYYADHLALFASAIGFFMIVVQIIEPAHKKLFTRVWQFFTAYLLAVSILDISGVSDDLDTVAPFLIAIVITVFVLFRFIILSARKGNREARLFLSALAVYAISAFLDILNYFQNVVFSPGTYEMHFAHYGGFAFLIFIAWILVTRYVEMNRKMLLAQNNERTRIARDLHDEIGPRLTEFKMTGENVKAIKNLTDEDSNLLNELSAAANEVASMLGEIVWLLNPTNDTLEEFCGYLSQYAINFLQKADVRCRIEMDPAFPDAEISYEVRHNILMAFKESLNNIVKHADASLVMVHISVKAGSLFIIVKDDGHGFNETEVRKYGHGLKNIEKRMKNINGSCSIESNSSMGTIIKMKAPFVQEMLFTQNGYLFRD